MRCLKQQEVSAIRADELPEPINALIQDQPAIELYLVQQLNRLIKAADKAGIMRV